ncbi:MAG: release factor glutamine methyltransferase [Candidatus Binatia bacterium]|nr:MAG: release factor glutamine methyltransferase [Candidatus Binatia bacterium]
MKPASPSVSEELARATRRLLEAGVATARLDAEVLLRHAWQKSEAWLHAHPTESVPSEIVTRFRALVDRRVRREPLAYVVGGKEFWSLWFELDSSVLVPRPETEHLVEAALELLRETPTPRIVDAGSGSGCIAVALGTERPDASLLAVDSEADALALAARNVSRYGLGDRVRLSRADLRHEALDGPFDLFVSNPPYVPSARISELDPEISRWEPRVALDGGEDGLELFRAFVARAARALGPGGSVALEVGEGQERAVAEILSSAGFENVQSRCDYAGRPRVLTARKRE